MSRRRLTTNHGDDALLCAGIEQFLGPTSLPLVQATWQPGLLITMRNPAHRLRRKMNQASHYQGALARRQLLQHKRPQHHSDWLNPSPQNLADCLPIFPRQMNFDAAS